MHKALQQSYLTYAGIFKHQQACRPLIRDQSSMCTGHISAALNTWGVAVQAQSLLAELAWIQSCSLRVRASLICNPVPAVVFSLQDHRILNNIM